MSALDGPTSKIALYDGSHSFFSLSPTVLQGHISHALSDPTFLTFRVFFDLDSDTGLFGSITNPNSAFAYFERIKDFNRFDALVEVINILRVVQTEAHHCFESISGLNEAWSRSMTDIVIKDKMLELSLMEAVDWRFIRALTLLRYILYDYNRMVYVLPINLRSFVMYAYITELRIFDEDLKEGASSGYETINKSIFGLSVASFADDPYKARNKRYEAEDLKNYGGKATRTYIESGGYILYSFAGCEFSNTSGSSIFDKFDNAAEPSMVKPSFKISYNKSFVTNRIPFVGNDIVDETSVVAEHEPKLHVEKTSAIKGSTVGSTVDKIGGAVTDESGKLSASALKAAVAAIVKQAANAIKEYAMDFVQAQVSNLVAEANIQLTRLQGKAYGNKFGTNLIDLYVLTNPQVIYSKARNAIAGGTSKTEMDAWSKYAAVSNVGSKFDETRQTANAGNIGNESIFVKPPAAKTINKLGNVFKDSM